MICLNCGRENPDGVKFCCFCGASAANLLGVTLEKNADFSPENGQLDVSESDAAVGAVSEKPENNDFFLHSPDLNAMPQNPSVPQPCAIPTNSAQTAAQNAAPPQQPAYDTRRYVNEPTNSTFFKGSIMMNVPIESASKQNGSERKFTGLHIALCLIATAVCAITAGIFAGLYFSVV